MLDSCLTDGPQIVSRRGVEQAVLVPIDEWRRLRGDAPTLKDLLLSDDARGEIPMPSRSEYGWRDDVDFG